VAMKDDGGTSSADAAPPAAPAVVTPDDMIVMQLMSMGFTQNGSQRAAVAVNNSNAEAATEWVFAHMGDSDFNDPLPDPSAAAAPAAAATGAAAGAAAGGSPVDACDEVAIATLSSFGFTTEQAQAALIATGQSQERAADWLFSRADGLDAAVKEVMENAAGGGGGGDGSGSGSGSGGGGGAKLSSGPGAYSIVGFISHMGKSTGSGHYVCHIKKDGKWVLFNDTKVAHSQVVPLEHGYLYLYRRNDL